MIGLAGSERDPEFLESFRAWLVRLPEDVEQLSVVLRDETVPRDSKIALASALNYLFKSLDLVDDGTTGLGFLDDAFVLRLMTKRAFGDAPEVLSELQAQADLVLEFLGDLAPRFSKYLATLEETRVRGRVSSEIVDDPALAVEFEREVRSFAQRYECPVLPGEATALVTLRSFLNAKLPV